MAGFLDRTAADVDLSHGIFATLCESAVCAHPDPYHVAASTPSGIMVPHPARKHIVTLILGPSEYPRIYRSFLCCLMALDGS